MDGAGQVRAIDFQPHSMQPEERPSAVTPASPALLTVARPVGAYFFLRPPAASNERADIGQSECILDHWHTAQR